MGNQCWILSLTLCETTGCGAAAAVPAFLEDVSLTSEIELPNEGRPELRKKSQRIGTDKKQVDKSPLKEGNRRDEELDME